MFLGEAAFAYIPCIGKVVAKESFVEYNLINIHAGRRKMVRFASVEEVGFKTVLGQLARWKAER